MIEHLLELLSDPAHLMFELVFSLVFDLLIMGLLFPLAMRRMRKAIYKEHLIIDKEHGIDHRPDTMDRTRAERKAFGRP